MKDPQVVLMSIVALMCIVATFLYNWLFIIPAAILSYLGWKRLLRKD